MHLVLPLGIVQHTCAPLDLTILIAHWIRKHFQDMCRTWYWIANNRRTSQSIGSCDNDISICLQSRRLQNAIASIHMQIAHMCPNVTRAPGLRHAKQCK